MAITYCNYTLPAPTKEIHDFVEKNFVLSQVFPHVFRALCEISSAIPHSTSYIFSGLSNTHCKLNCLVWPNMASRWSYGCFIATSSIVEQISPYVWPQVSIGLNSYSKNACKLSIQTDPSHTTLTTYMYCLTPIPLSFVINNESLYLLPLVDERYFWWWKILVYLNFDSWDHLMMSIFQQLGVPVYHSPVSGYGYPDSSLSELINLPIPLVIDVVAAHIGKIFTRHLNGECNLKSVTESSVFLNAQWNQLHPVVSGWKLGYIP